MSLQFTPYIIAYLAAGAMSLGTALYVWRRRAAHGAWPLFLALLAEVEWACSSAATLCFASASGQVFFVKVAYVGIVSLPPAFFAFALVYSGREYWLTRRVVIALAALPLITLLVLATNDVHGLMYAHFGLDTTAGFARPVSVRGPWFWVHTVFSYSLLLGAALLVLFTVLETPSSYRHQVVFLLFGASVPLLANLMQVTGANPLPVDMTPLAFSVGSSAIGLSLFRYHLLDITPVARSIVIDGLADGVLVLDAQNRVVDANPGALRILGRPAGEVVGQPAASVLSAYPDLVERYRDMTQGEAEISAEVEGVRRHYALRFSAITGYNGANIGRVIVARDFTDRIRLIEELDAYSRVVAHDLKNPIAVISGYAHLLEANVGKSLSEENARLIRDTIRGCERMTRIVNDLLFLSHVRTLDSVGVGPLNMAGVVAEVTDRMATVISGAGARIFIPGEWPQAQGYSPWIEEVWTNYISNAIKYGGSPPRVELGGEKVENGMVRFWVRDNGCGIAEHDRDRLFREFSRLQSSRSDSHGLGLSIVKRIVEKLGGKVGVESVIGEGSTFWFTLPSPRGWS
jgi:PAS domain S-box-containing protein